MTEPAILEDQEHTAKILESQRMRELELAKLEQKQIKKSKPLIRLRQ